MVHRCGPQEVSAVAHLSRLHGGGHDGVKQADMLSICAYNAAWHDPAARASFACHACNVLAEHTMLAKCGSH